MNATTTDPEADQISEARVSNVQEDRNNALESVRRKRREKQDAVKVEKLRRGVEHLDGEVVLQYKYVPVDRGQRQAQNLKNVPDNLKQYYAACDVLILGCEEILLRTGETPDGKPVLIPLAGRGEEPVTLNDVGRVCEALEIPADEVTTARALCLELFGTEYAVLAEANRVSEWMQTLKKSSDEAFLDG